MAANFEPDFHSRLEEKKALRMNFDNLSVEALAEMKTEFAQLIKDLQVENHNLQTEVNHTEQLIIRYSQQESEVEPFSKQEKMDLKQLENLLSWCKNSTGIVMGQDVFGYTVKSINNHEIIKEYKIHVLCVNIELFITVQLKSDLRLPDTNYEIIRLKVEIPNADVRDEISSTLEELEKSLDLITTLRFLSSYGMERFSRQKIFDKLFDDPERSPFIASIKDNPNCLLICDPNNSSVKIIVEWQIRVNLLFRAYSDLKISYKVSKSKTDSSEKTSLEKIPEMFTEMIEVKGKEFTIFALIDMMRRNA